MRLLAVAAVVATLTACGGGDGPAAPPSRAPDTVGPVSDVSERSVRIDDGTGELPALAARVDDDTRVLRRRSDDYDAASLDGVRVGDPVEVWVDGPVAESSPVQAHAAVVVLADS